MYYIKQKAKRYYILILVYIYPHYGTLINLSTHLCFKGSLCPLLSSGEIPLKDKEIPVRPSTEHVLVIKRGDQVSDGAIMVIMHGQAPVRGEVGQGVRLIQLVDTDTPIGGTSQ